MSAGNGDILFAAGTDRGQVRRSNQDSIHAALAPSGQATGHGHLFIVADGMGGHAGGDIASKLAKDSLRDYYYGTPMAAADDPAPVLEEAFQLANRRILDEGQQNPEYYRMGTTCTAAVVRDGRFWIAHVGDSRAYFYRGRELKQITRDHNLAEDLRREGTLSNDEAATHKGQHILTRALGTEKQANPEIAPPRALHAGDKILLCSDGLIRVVSDDELAHILATEAVSAASERLIAEANRQGGPDNISVVLIEKR